MGTASVAAGVAGLTVFVSLSGWLMHGGALANGVAYAAMAPDSPAAPASFLSFEERFSSGRSALTSESIAVRTTAAAPPIAVPAAPAGKGATPSVRVAALEPAASQSVVALPVPKAAPPRDPALSNPLSGDTAHTAIYDISAHTVYLPNGRRLEAHSGLGEHIDDVRAVHLKMRGPTPPNVYELKMREGSFHGVQAVRLNPVDSGRMYGRDGILAHPFMLGPNGQSNGCVSFKDYPAFLAAYQRGEVTRLVVVEQLGNPPAARTADWFSNTLKSVLGRS